MGLIFYMSAENASQSTKTSSGVIEKIAEAFISSYKNKSPEDKKIVISSLQHFVRKMAHFLIYAALGFSCTGFASTFKVSAAKKLIYCQIFCSFYAVTDEIHQKFSPGRSCEIKDMLLDSVGSFFGIITILLFLTVLAKIKSKGETKVKKRELIEQLETLTDKLLEADSHIEQLRNELIYKNNEIARLKEKLEKAESREIKEETAQQTVEEVVEAVAEETAEIFPISQPEQDTPEETKEREEESVIKDYHDFDFITSTSPKTEISAKDYSVKVIGKIVMESVKVNCVLASSENENKKELINLVLGRTEVAKEEISSLLSCGLEEDVIKASIDKESEEVTEYFQSILGQI